MSRINVHNAGNPYRMAIVILLAGLREVPISPLEELSVVKDHLLIEALEEEATVRRVARPVNLKWKAQ